MNLIFEDRTTYDPKTEPVCVVSLAVECHPKQAQSVMDFLDRVRTQAGVYAVSIDSLVSAPVIEQSRGADDGKQQIQQPDSNDYGAAIGRSRSAPKKGRAAEVKPSDGNGALPGAAGQGRSGSGSGDAGSKDLRKRTGNSRKSQ